jgi:hypothetical protein
MKIFRSKSAFFAGLFPATGAPFRRGDGADEDDCAKAEG